MQVPLLQNIYWKKELCLLVFVWMSFLALQIAKNSTGTCSTSYWILNFLQVSSATATFAMSFSSSMSVVEYYLLKRFPIPYGIMTRHYVVITKGSFNLSNIYGICERAPLKKIAYDHAAAYFFLVATVAAFVGQHVVSYKASQITVNYEGL